MRWNLLSLFGRNDDATQRDIKRREQETKDARMLNRLRRSEAYENLFANMRTDPGEDIGN